MCYERTGRLVAGFETIGNVIRAARRNGEQTNLMAALTAYSMLSCDLGKLSAASAAASEAIGISDAVEDANWMGIAHRSYARVLMTCGDFDEAQRHLTIARHAYRHFSTFAHGRSVLLSLESILNLWQGYPKEALECARQVGELAQSASLVREAVVAKWLKGTILLTLAISDPVHLPEASRWLSDALTDARRINLLELEVDILLSWARWHMANGDELIASQYAEQALVLSRRCGYRLKEADILTFRGELALSAGDVTVGRGFVESARDIAWCDGPPYSYRMAVGSSCKLLRAQAI
jgi:tetratricopeptide (TPR) repeat protein